MKIERLDWDSDFFDKNISKVVIDKEDSCSDIEAVLSKETDDELYYIFTNFNYPDLKIDGVVKVDEKTCYQIDLKDVQLDSTSNSIVRYEDSIAKKELYDIVYESGKYSRFLLDEKFEEQHFLDLYATWLDKSLSGEIADIVYCYSQNDKVLGLITFQKKGDVGIIGLVGVLKQAQGLGVGKKLMTAIFEYAVNENLSKIEVVTQGHNDVACRYYESFGFSVKEVTKIYHYWRT